MFLHSLVLWGGGGGGEGEGCRCYVLLLGPCKAQPRNCGLSEMICDASKCMLKESSAHWI